MFEFCPIQSSADPRTDLPDWIRDFYKKHRGQIDRSINKVFAEKYEGTPDVAATIMPRQTVRNAPELDVSLTQFQLQGNTQHDNIQGTYSLAGYAATEQCTLQPIYILEYELTNVAAGPSRASTLKGSLKLSRRHLTPAVTASMRLFGRAGQVF